MSEDLRAAKRAYDKTPAARAAKALRRARPEQRAKTKAYNDKWFAVHGRARNAAAVKNRRRYRRTEKGRQTRNRLARFWNAHRRAAEITQACTCCDRAAFRLIYELAVWMDCEVDHRTPLALGGAHCTHNLQLLTKKQHRVKTTADLQAIREARRAA
jgi:5-methylcytosine-specific restriction endonuclease McrA